MNRFRLPCICLGILALALPVGAQEKDYVKPIIDKAVKAVGVGKKQKLRGLTCNIKLAVPAGNNGNVELTGSWSVNGIDQYRAEMSASLPNGQAKSVTLVINGKNGWAFDAGRNKTEPAPAELLPTIRADLRAMRFAHMPNLLRGKGLKLSPLGEMKIDGKDAVGISVKQKGLPDVSMYFDKKSGLPLKASVYGKINPTGKEGTHAFTFAKYKKSGGMNHFTRITIFQDDKRICDVHVSEIELAENIDRATFKKPG